MTSILLIMIYISFVSLGLPDALLGAAWPTMYPQFGVNASYMGPLAMTISLATVVSSLFSDRLTRRFGTGPVTACSVALTAAAILGFSVSRSYWALFLWAIPYGLGAGSVDASLNNYVAIHYASRHMSWLHCMWGIGAAAGPYVMGWALTGGMSWNMGYRYIGIFQVVLTAALFATLSLWRGKQAAQAASDRPARPLTFRQILAIPGARQIFTAFFCYCAIEQTAGAWASSYLVLKDGVSADEAASLASLFYIGITAGRLLSGFLTLRFTDRQMIRMGQAGMLLGLVIMLLPFGKTVSMIGLVIIGFGCAPVYPCVIHSTPEHFGAENSQAMIGVQMASAYVGILLMPPLYGLIATHISAGLLPVFLLALLALMAAMLERMNRIHMKKSAQR